MAFFGGRFGDFGKKKRDPFTLKGTIITYDNGIQRIKTEVTTQREFEWIQCMGWSLIKCPVCKDHPYAAHNMVFARPCEHVKPGTKVLLHYVTHKEGEVVVGGGWTGKVLL